jgi:hypothetical protein
MIYHVLPGDAIVTEFSKTGIEGKTIVCREAFILGPLDGEMPDEFWDRRAKFILGEYGEDEIQYHEAVADELEKLEAIEAGDEVNLWFEYELFCQVNLWFCLSRLANSGAEINRVAPVVISEEDRWKGFGGLSSEDLKKCFEARLQLTRDDVELGIQLWEKYRAKDAAGLLSLGVSATPVFPYLDETVEAAARIDTGPISVVRQIRSEGVTDPDVVFVEFSKRAGVYGLGDLQVFEMLERL